MLFLPTLPRYYSNIMYIRNIKKVLLLCQFYNAHVYYYGIQNVFI